MAQQTSESQHYSQQLKHARQKPLQLCRQQAGGDQLQEGNEPPVEGSPAVPQLEQSAKHQGPGGPGEERSPIQGDALQQQRR